MTTATMENKGNSKVALTAQCSVLLLLQHWTFKLFTQQSTLTVWVTLADGRRPGRANDKVAGTIGTCRLHGYCRCSSRGGGSRRMLTVDHFDQCHGASVPCLGTRPARLAGTRQSLSDCESSEFE